MDESRKSAKVGNEGEERKGVDSEAIYWEFLYLKDKHVQITQRITVTRPFSPVLIDLIY